MHLPHEWWSLRRHGGEPPPAQPDSTIVDPDSRLAALLDAVAGPPRPVTRAGEDTAVAAYRAGRADARHRPILRSPALPWARAGAWIVAVAVAGTAGGALAAGVQDPERMFGSTEGNGRAPSTTQASSARRDPASLPTRAPSPTASRGPASAAALHGLCTAYLANGEQRGKALSSTAFRELVAAAGGPGRVAAYCEDLVASATPKPSRHGRPSSAPSHPAIDAGVDPPTGQPAA